MLDNLFGRDKSSNPTNATPAEEPMATNDPNRPPQPRPVDDPLARRPRPAERENAFNLALEDLRRNIQLLYESVGALADHYHETGGDPRRARDCRDCVHFRVGLHVPCVMGVDPHTAPYLAVRCPKFEETSENRKLINRDEAGFNAAVRRAREG